MEYRLLGRTGVRVSPLCFGTMSFGGIADEATSAAMFERCVEAGVNVFDCADVYNEGRAEEILGRLVKGRRDEVVLATKVYFASGRGPNDRGSSRYHMVRALEGSLKRMGTDRADLYYLHRFDESADLEETLRAMEDLVRQGKVLYPAVSNFAAWQIAKALGLAALNRWAPLVCVQPMYNLLKRQAEVEILPMAQAEGLAVMPYGPQGGGLLSGKYGVGKRPVEGRLMSNAMYQRRYEVGALAPAIDRFVSLAAEAGMHPATMAIAWVAAHPGVTAPIIGARNVAQLEPCLASMEVRLDDDLYRAISALTPTPPPATDRSEEALGVIYKSP